MCSASKIPENINENVINQVKFSKIVLIAAIPLLFFPRFSENSSNQNISAATRTL